MKTEEGKLKDQVKLYLKQLGAFFFMPVQQGYGKQGVDFFCCVPYQNGSTHPVTWGRFVAIETKAPGEEPTPRQEQCLKEVNEAGGIGFYCDSYDSFKLTMAAHGFPPVPKI